MSHPFTRIFIWISPNLRLADRLRVCIPCTSVLPGKIMGDGPVCQSILRRSSAESEHHADVHVADVLFQFTSHRFLVWLQVCLSRWQF